MEKIITLLILFLAFGFASHGAPPPVLEIAPALKPAPLTCPEIIADLPTEKPLRVNSPVAGLYQSIPFADIYNPLLQTFTDERIDTVDYTDPDSLQTVTEVMKAFDTDLEVFAPSTRANRPPARKGWGKFVRKFSMDKKTIFLESADLELHENYSAFASVPGVVPLVEGKGVPLQALVTLMQMRMAGVSYGTLTKAVSHITNEKTQSELNNSTEIKSFLKKYPGQRPPNEMIARALPETHTYRYFSTFLIQSGHKIKKVAAFSYGGVPFGVGDFTIFLELEPWDKK